MFYDKRFHSTADGKDCYEKALKESGYKNHTLKFSEEAANVGAKKKRSRKILYFNPPWSRNVATNITKLFHGLIRKQEGDPYGEIV